MLPIHRIAATPSTNTLALAAAQSGVATGVWLADEQTAGRGRGGHIWHSPAAQGPYVTGLYVSILVRPPLAGSDALKLSLAAALAVQSAVQQTSGFLPDIRWPNDLMLSSPQGPQKKFGGILTETAIDARTAQLSYAVVGIGLNLNQTAFPAELEAQATSLRQASGYPVDREPLLEQLLVTFQQEVASLPSVLERFEAASTWTQGMPVHVAEDDGYTGVTVGLDPHGLLRVRLADGTTRTVRHGGVRQLQITQAKQGSHAPRD